MQDSRPVRISRRAVLRRAGRASVAALIAMPMAGCGLLEEDPTEGGLRIFGTTTPTPAPPPVTPVPTDSPGTPEPTALASTEPPVITLDPPEVGQGETTVLTVKQGGAAAGSVSLFGQRIPLIAAGDGRTLWCVAGAGLYEAVGAKNAAIVTRDSGGSVISEVSLPFAVVAVERPVDYLTASPSVTAVLTPEAAEIEAALRAYEQFNLFGARPQWDGTIQLPVEDYIQTTTFGEGRSLNGGPVTGQHSGTDMAAPSGTPILAPAPGRVAWAGAMPIRGNSVLVDHGAGVVTGYHHLLEWGVEVGQMVGSGEEIAKMGSTGFSTGPHLHWEMTIYGVNVDPMTWVGRGFGPAA